MIVLIIIIVIIVITNSNSSNNDSNNGLCTDLSKQDKVYSTPKDPHWVSWGEKPFLYREETLDERSKNLPKLSQLEIDDASE